MRNILVVVNCPLPDLCTRNLFQSAREENRENNENESSGNGVTQIVWVVGSHTVPAVIGRSRSGIPIKYQHVNYRGREGGCYNDRIPRNLAISVDFETDRIILRGQRPISVIFVLYASISCNYDFSSKIDFWSKLQIPPPIFFVNSFIWNYKPWCRNNDWT